MADKKLTQEEVASNLEMVRHITDWLHHRDMNQRELAERLRMTPGQISKWINGKATMSAAQFKKVAAILGISWAQLSGPPDQAARNELYKEVAEVIGDLSEDGLRTVLTIARALRKSRTE